MAFSVIAVSIRVSPFLRDELPTAMFMTSAPSRFPANSNEDCVRVETSKNRLISVRPRSEARFFSIWRFRSTNSSARSRRPVISSAESPSIPNRWRLWRTNVLFAAMFIKATPIVGVGQTGQDRARPVHRAARLSAACYNGPPEHAMTTQQHFAPHDILNQSPPYKDAD